MGANSSILAWKIPGDRGAWWATVRKESDMMMHAGGPITVPGSLFLVS